MDDYARQSRPAWQTFELDEEWPDEEDEEEEDANGQHAGNHTGGSSIELTTPLGSVNFRGSTSLRRSTNSSRSGSPEAVGTFLVREDAPGPLLPNLNAPMPGAKKQGGMKNMFSPLALETMFEPPSPPKAGPSSQTLHPTAPPVPSRLSQVHAASSFEQDGDTESTRHSHVQLDDTQSTQHSRGQPDEILETDLPNVGGFHGLRPRIDCQFTFSVPHGEGGAASTSQPQAQSTPVASQPKPQFLTPATDPRLRLFQFQYDTYTRDHLSAMVDSIAVNSPSLSNTGNLTNHHSSPFGLSRMTETTMSSADVRSAKRVKLSPQSDFEAGDGDGENAVIQRPTLRRDYVGESEALMAKIKQTRDFSTISTVASRSGVTHEPDTPEAPAHTRSGHLRVPGPSDHDAVSSSGGSLNSSKGNTYSSLGYREKGAALMEQIKQDMKGSKRLFSADTDITQLSDEHDGPTLRRSVVGESSRAPHQRRPSYTTRRGAPASPARSRNAPLSPARPRQAASRALPQQDQPDSSMDTSKFYAQFPAPPVIVAPALSPLRASTASQRSHSHASLHGAGASFGSGAPAYPSASLRARTQEDLNRLVSGSSAAGTVVTAGSAESFVKHAGPAQITRIAPEDIPALPERVGGMVYDKSQMRWVKVPERGRGRVSAGSEAGYAASAEDGESEDPFRDIESLREDDSIIDGSAGGSVIMHSDGEPPEYPPQIQYAPAEMSRIEEAADDEEAELTSFSFDGPPPDGMPSLQHQTMYFDDSESDDDLAHGMGGMAIGEASMFVAANDQTFDDDEEPQAYLDVIQPEEDTGPSPQPAPSPELAPYFAEAAQPVPFSTPLPARNSSAPTPIRSALKNSSVKNTSSASAVPFASLRASSVATRTPANKYRHRRSVSFSDGKHDGPIRGLGREDEGGAETSTSAETGAEMTGTELETPAGAGIAAASFVPSARSKRLENMLAGLVDSSSEGTASPTRPAGTARPPPEELQRMADWRPQSNTSGSSGVSAPSRRQLSRTNAFASTSGVNANATFLTEASFGVAHDRLVTVITDVQPFEPYWEDLGSIDLSDKRLDSVARLKEFLPQLRTLSINQNQLAWLSGLPASLRTLSVAHNALTRMTSFKHLAGLESLDVSHNDIESLAQLECLRHLRELRADGNRISSLDGLSNLDSLAKLSLQDNALVSLTVIAFPSAAAFSRDPCCSLYRPPSWNLPHLSISLEPGGAPASLLIRAYPVNRGKLEMLNLSHNRLQDLRGLAALKALIVLNLDQNNLSELAVGGALARLRVLRVSGNRLQRLSARAFPHVRTLYADNNALPELTDARRLSRLENLSLRNQGGKGLSLTARDVRDVKRLYLSGNALPASFLSEPCYNLVYLELAACRLTSLPAGLPTLVPNLRALNLNYNFLDDAALRALEGLSRLTKLTVIGSRLKGTKALVRVLRGCPDAEVVDLRMNPATLGWYLPLLVHDAPGALAPERGGDGARWTELDAKFRRDLPDSAYAGRLAYRGLAMRACPRLRVLDGVPVSAKERDKAERLLAGVLGRSK
ncbi:L domain-like protein [Peniophora sp. CONT]|nr:L domain-like protein [Peniophora sp. CONT]